MSAIASREPDGLLAAVHAVDAMARLSAQADAWEEIQPSPRLRSTAERVCRTHPLRAADASRREGFPIVQPG